MQVKGLGKTDRILLVSSLVGAIVFAFLIAYDDVLYEKIQSSSANQESIGEVIRTRNDARRRLSQSLNWYPAASKEKIYALDSIFTGNDSEMSIRLGDRQEINLTENSFVVLKKDNEDLLLDLKLGSFEATDTDQNKLKVLVNDKMTVISTEDNAAPIYINKTTEGKLNVLSPTSSVKLTVGDQNITLDKNEAIDISQDYSYHKNKFPVAFTSHKLRDKIWLEPNDSIAFKWKSESTSFEYKLEVSNSSGTSNVVFKEVIPDFLRTGEVKWVPDKFDEVYNFRITNVKGDKSLSVVHSISVNEIKPISLYYPNKNEEFYAEMAGREKNRNWPISFDWGEVKNIAEYTLEVATDKFFKNIILREVTEVAYFNTEFSPGQYFWRVTPNEGPREKMRSEIRQFSIGPFKNLLAEDIPLRMHGPFIDAEGFNENQMPTLLDKTQTVVLNFGDQQPSTNRQQLLQAIKNPPTIRWADMSGADHYKIQYDIDARMKNIKEIKNVRDNKYTFKAIEPGEYYWRIIAFKGELFASRPSEIGKLRVQVPMPVIEPIEVNTRMGRQKVAVTWSKTPLAEAYSLVLNSNSQVISTNTVQFEIKPGFENEVRVAAINNRGEPISEFATQKISFETRPDIRAPASIMPANNITVVAFDKQKFDPMLFSWKKSAGATGYELQFSKDNSFSKILLSQSTAQSSYVLNKRLDTGVIFWRVRAKQGKFNSPWSEVRSYQIQVSDN